jgi:hypothetical protein
MGVNIVDLLELERRVTAVLLCHVQLVHQKGMPGKTATGGCALPFPQINIRDARFKEKSLSIHCYQQIFIY